MTETHAAYGIINDYGDLLDRGVYAASLRLGLQNVFGITKRVYPFSVPGDLLE
jgi:hypothetical protein